MTRSIIILLLFIVVSCKTLKKTTDTGNVVSNFINTSGNSSIIKGRMYEKSTKDSLKLCDVWIGNIRYDCDSSGRFQLEVKPGRYKLNARAFGFSNISYKVRIKRGQQIVLEFYMSPYRDEKLIHNEH